jgi:hypothetical protein
VGSSRNARLEAIDLKFFKFPFFVNSNSIEHSFATSFTKSSNWWMLSWSTTKTHPVASGSVAMVRAIWAAKSSLVRVLPI